MFRWGLCVVCLLAQPACQSAPPPAHPQRWAKAWINALNSHRGEQAFPLLRDTGTYEDPVIVKPISGVPLRILLTARWRQYPKMHYVLGHVSGDAQTVVAEWTAAGLSREPSDTLAGVFVLRVRDDTLTSVRAYYNAAEVR